MHAIESTTSIDLHDRRVSKVGNSLLNPPGQLLERGGRTHAVLGGPDSLEHSRQGLLRQQPQGQAPPEGAGRDRADLAATLSQRRKLGLRQGTQRGLVKFTAGH